MEGNVATLAVSEPTLEVVAAERQTNPLVLASPHSGTNYPPDLLAASRLDPLSLRRSEDSYVDEIFGAAPALGSPLLKARFARAYLDPNREPFELDPAMFEDALPDFVNRHSPRVRVGLGTIARVVASGEEIYARKLRFAEAVQRIERLYRPYHRALAQLVEATRNRFGFYLLLDCHSMPSTTLPPRGGLGRGRVDIVLGDCHGTSCDPIVADTAQRVLVDKGYSVVRNAPYAGGFTTTHYGKPGEGGHCLQIEIGRGLYMDERSYERKAFFAQLAKDMRDLTIALAGIDPALLRPA
ncbi:MAG TPA: N-formylglutamate amidohydrolase [Stellaceae bacterium]|jgi:N-formylglutamate amidohydrolase